MPNIDACCIIDDVTNANVINQMFNKQLFVSWLVNAKVLRFDESGGYACKFFGSV